MSVRIRDLVKGETAMSNRVIVRRIITALVAVLGLLGLGFALSQSEPNPRTEVKFFASATATVHGAPVPVVSTSSVSVAPTSPVVPASETTATTEPSASASPVPPPVARTPQEDSPDFNPCVHGVNGTYPENDPRYYIPGPCDITTRLPHGRYFSVQVRPIPGVDCAGYVHVEVTVFVHERNGDIRGGVGTPGCAPRGALVGSDGVSGPAGMEALYRDAATRYGS